MSIFTLRKNSKRVVQAQVPQRTTVYNHIHASGNVAEEIHTYIKLAKRQGVKLSRGYKHSFMSVNAINLTISGPAAVVDPLNVRLQDIFEGFRSVR